MNPIIRYASYKEIPQLVDLLTQLSGGKKWYESSQQVQQSIRGNFARLAGNRRCYFWVMLDKDKIIGTLTFLIDHKLSHEGGKVGRIEDLVIDENYRGLGLGKELVEKAKNKAKQIECYKVILNCSQDNIPFYVKCGFHKSNVEMRYDIKI